MFSGLAFLIGGNMAVAASVLGGALIRVDPAKSTRLITTTVAEPMRIDGRSMGPGWTDLDAEHVRTKRQLEKWIESPLHPSSSIILGDDRTSRRRGADQDRRGQRGRRRFHDAALRCADPGVTFAAYPALPDLRGELRAVALFAEPFATSGWRDPCDSASCRPCRTTSPTRRVDFERAPRSRLHLRTDRPRRRRRRRSVVRYRMIGNDPGTRREVSVLSLGAMLFGTATDEVTSFAILDRFVEAGGTFIDTSNNYAFWNTGSQGGESEALLGRWRRSRGVGDQVVIATKLGGRPVAPGTSFADAAMASSVEGLSAKVIRESAERSRERLGMARLDLLYAHIEDPAVPVHETVDGFAELVAEGTVGLLGVSNHWAWRVERARTLAAAAGLPGYEVLQYQHSYLRARSDLPGRRSPDGNQGAVSGDLLSYLRAEPELALVAYSPLLSGGYVRPDSRWVSSSTIRAPPLGWQRSGTWPSRPGRPSTKWYWPG